jgi:hypothetical protein
MLGMKLCIQGEVTALTQGFQVVVVTTLWAVEAQMAFPKNQRNWTKPLPRQLLLCPFHPQILSPFTHSLFGA